MYRGALDAPRFVDDSLKYPRDGIAAKRASGSFSVRLHVMQHLRLTVRLIDFKAQLLLQFPDLQGAVGSFRQQLHQLFIQLVDLSS